jgi:hypothetical protein
MVAIDAEFVAVARAETSFEGGVEVQLKPSRWEVLLASGDLYILILEAALVVGVGVGVLVAIDAELVAAVRAETNFEMAWECCLSRHGMWVAYSPLFCFCLKSVNGWPKFLMAVIDVVLAVARAR